MKALFLFLFAILILPLNTSAQDIYLTTQAEVNAFNYTSVTGLLSISEASPGNITNLNNLAGLTSVGSLLIFNNSALANFDGLSDLTSVADNFRILSNSNMPHILNIGFSSLTSVGGSLEISNNTSLFSIYGFNNLTYIGGNLIISSNNGLTSIEGFHILNTVVGNFEISSNEYLEYTSPAFHNLSSVGGFFKISGGSALVWSFENLSSVGAFLEISNNDANGYSLAEISFVNLTSVGGDLSIRNNRDLLKIILPNLTSLAGDLVIAYNYDLTNIELDNLPSVENLYITGNVELTYIGLINLNIIENNLYLGYNYSLTNIDGLGLSSVGGSVGIVSNDALTNIDPLSNLSSVSGLEINNNDALPYLQFDNLTSVGGDLKIIDNDALPNLDGFAVLNSVGGDLEISDNDALTNAFGSYPHNLTIGGSLHIRLNSSLVFIEGLSNLPSLGGDLEIIGNASLSNIQELENIGSIGGNISISNNSSLPLISFSDLTSLGGSFAISDNASLTNIYVSALPSVPADLTIQNNAALVNIDELPYLTTVGGFLSIAENASLTNLDGLSGLTSVGGVLQIALSASLTNLDGLSGLTSVGGSLSIQSNSSLTNLDGLSSLASVVVDLDIFGNVTLSEFCGLYTLLNGGGLAGSYNVSGNAANPTEQQIIDGGACGSAPPVTSTFYMTNVNDDFMYYSGSRFSIYSRFGESTNGYVGIEQVYKNVTIPPNATITSAVVEVKAKANRSGTAVADIYSDLRDNPTSVMSYSQFNGGTFFSTETIQYSAPSFTVNNLYQIDITNVIQDRVNKLDWNSGDNLGLIIKGNTSLSANALREITRAENSLTDNKIIISYTVDSGPPSIDSIYISSVSATTVTLNAEVNTGNQSTVVRFQWDTDSLSWANDFSAKFSPLTSNGEANLNVTGLTPITTYYYRAYVTNASGSYTSFVKSFVTPQPPTPVINTFYMTNMNDDIMYYSGNRFSNYSRFGESTNGYVGIEQIYKNVSVPQNIEIISAILEVKAKDNRSGTMVADIYSDLRDNPSSVLSYSQFNGSTNFSIETIQYSAPPFTINNLYQIDVTSVIQDRVNQSDWTNGDNLGLIIKGNAALSTNSLREITRAENSLTDNKLIITYNAGLPKFAYDNESEILPDKYELYQNYPNPFNPSTSIRFSLPEAGSVKLDIFNILGENVKTLINEEMSAGFHTVVFDAANLPSGTYIYRIQTSSFLQTKKMLLIK